MKRPQIHVIGAGFSGLTAALRLAEAGRFDVVLHERRTEPGGRRRAFYDPADGAYVDSFNAWIPPQGRATRALIRAVGAESEWRASQREIAFVDMTSGERWSLKPGVWPWGALLAKRRAPGLSARDYVRATRFARSPQALKPPTAGLAAERLWRPLSLAALNREPNGAAVDLLATSLHEALAAPNLAPMTPARDFRHALLLPLAQQLSKRGVVLRFERTLKALRYARARVAALEFEHDSVELQGRDAVVLAVPPWVAAPLLPGLLTPDEFGATITAHFETPPQDSMPDLTVVLNAPVHMIFRRPEGLSVSVRDAASELDTPKEALAARFWAAAAPIAGLSDSLPAWRVIPQKRATFSATPGQNALRPDLVTPWRNLVLAGAYVRSGLPETLESAVRSGQRAADALAEMI